MEKRKLIIIFLVLYNCTVHADFTPISEDVRALYDLKYQQILREEWDSLYSIKEMDSLISIEDKIDSLSAVNLYIPKILSHLIENKDHTDENLNLAIKKIDTLLHNIDRHTHPREYLDLKYTRAYLVDSLEYNHSAFFSAWPAYKVSEVPINYYSAPFDWLEYKTEIENGHYLSAKRTLDRIIANASFYYYPTHKDVLRAIMHKLRLFIELELYQDATELIEEYHQKYCSFDLQKNPDYSAKMLSTHIMLNCFNIMARSAEYELMMDEATAQFEELMELREKVGDYFPPFKKDLSDWLYMRMGELCMDYALTFFQPDSALAIGNRLMDERIRYNKSNIALMLSDAHLAKGDSVDGKEVIKIAGVNSIMRSHNPFERLSSDIRVLRARLGSDDDNNILRSAASTYRRCCEQNKDLLSNMSYLTRTSYCKNLEKLSEIFGNIASRHSSDSAFAGAYFNSLILSKHRMIETENDLHELSLIAPYSSRLQSRLENYQHQLMNLYGKGIFASDSIKHLNILLEETEDSLSNERRRIGYNYFNSKPLSWNDIKNALNPDEIAVEFGYLYHSLNPRWVAVVLKGDKKLPVFYDLANAHDYRYKKDLDTGEMYEKIWEPILRDVSESTKTIYFSPCDGLSSIPLEYATKGSKKLSELYNVYRLTSTRQLLHRNKTVIKSACLFGGLDYDESIGDSTLDNNAKEVTSHTDCFRGSWDPLPETEEEVKSISSMLENHGMLTHCYTGNRGNEHSFKSLNTESVNLLHIATHGFYYGNWDNNKKNDYGYQEKLRKDEYKEMQRSGLLMSGAKLFITSRKRDAHEEDNILTASEIARMRFRNLSLVVLSACDTGVGDLGLYRAFKKAGAQSILMSLHPVPSDETRKLMENFYRYMLIGYSKQESLRAAQRDINGGYAFVLLDGLE